MEAIKEPYWPLIVVVFAGGVALAVSQFFMIGRYWQMCVCTAFEGDTRLLTFRRSRHHFVFGLLLITLLGAVRFLRLTRTETNPEARRRPEFLEAGF